MAKGGLCRAVSDKGSRLLSEEKALRPISTRSNSVA